MIKQLLVADNELNETLLFENRKFTGTLFMKLAVITITEKKVIYNSDAFDVVALNIS